MSRACPAPRSGDCRKAVMVGTMAFLRIMVCITPGRSKEAGADNAAPNGLSFGPPAWGCAPYAEWQRLRSRNLLQPVNRLERLALCGHGKPGWIASRPVRPAGARAAIKLAPSAPGARDAPAA